MFNKSNYQKKKAEAEMGSDIPAGRHRVKIVAVKNTDEYGNQIISKGGNPMTIIHMYAEGHRYMIKEYITHGEFFDVKLGYILDSCNLLDFISDTNPFNWSMLPDAIGCAEIKTEIYKGKPTSKVDYWITPEKTQESQQQTATTEFPQTAGTYNQKESADMFGGASNAPQSDSFDDVPF